jgi:hypothetical protein
MSGFYPAFRVLSAIEAGAIIGARLAETAANVLVETLIDWGAHMAEVIQRALHQNH